MAQQEEVGGIALGTTDHGDRVLMVIKFPDARGTCSLDFTPKRARQFALQMLMVAKEVEESEGEKK